MPIRSKIRRGELGPFYIPDPIRIAGAGLASSLHYLKSIGLK